LMKTINKTIAIFLSIFMLHGLIQAQDISEEKAGLIAKNFFYERSNAKETSDYQDINLQKPIVKWQDGKAVLYIFNIKDGGFVFVSGHQSTPPVLGFSFTGKYTDLDAPPQLRGYLQSISAQIASNMETNQVPDVGQKEEWDRLLQNNKSTLKIFKGRSIEPLLYSTWDQGSYYNEMCPEDDAGPSGHCYAGCVATAMGQVINYFRWPQQGTGEYSYDCPPYGTLSANFAEANYLWNEMPLELKGSNIPTATLLNHLGISVDMVYGPDGSGMYNHKAAYSLATYFKYSPETQYVYRDSTSMDWDSLLLNHLDKQIPMYYAGWSVPNINGHAFVCDGYQEPGYYHFNWGWSASYDGYFYTDDLTPGGSYFNDAQELIINAFPDTTTYTYPAFTSGKDTLTTYSGTIDDGSGPVYNYQNNAYHSWLISPADSVEFITINFLNFSTEASDSVTIYNGNDSLSPILGSFAGDALPPKIVSTSDQVFITFSSAANTIAPGWLLSYESEIPVYCSGLVMLQEITDTFSDGSGPRNYHNASNCLWNIKPDVANEITIHFLEFETEAGKDVLKIYDGTDLLAELSGSELPDPLTAYNGSMFLTFSSNSTVTGNGWTAYYETDAVGQEELSAANEFQVYPNPTKDILTIRHNKIGQEAMLELFSIDGRMVISEKQNATNLESVLDLTTLDNGLYLLVITSKDNKQVQKIIKTSK
jgi:peptidase C10-like protein/CUB-like protein/Spi protease inhibitor/type IX secretion system substrate protein